MPSEAARKAAERIIGRLDDQLIGSQPEDAETEELWTEARDKAAGIINEAIAAETEKLRAAQKLCEIYFDIAAEQIGEDEVRRRRDERLKSAALATRETRGSALNEKGGE